MEAQPSSKSDIISSLPKDAIDSILALLPIKDAIKTSILSSKWRYAWTTLPSLVFTDRQLPELKTNIVQIIDQVLSRHMGMLIKFHLSTKLRDVPDLDRWMPLLGSKGIQEFILKLDWGVQYKVPFSLFSFESLKYLKLSSCNISIPSDFRSFDMLTYLHLSGVHFTDNGLQNLLSKCPCLTNLELIGLFYKSYLEIHAPNLKKLWFSGVFIDLYFDAPSLSELHFYLIDSVPSLKDGAQNRGMPVLYRSFQHMGNIETLGLCGSTLNFMLLCSPQESLELACSHVKTLRLTLNYEDRRETVALLHLLRDCPLLQYLEIMTESHQATAMVSIGSYWETMDYPDYTFDHLRETRMTAFSASVPELELMRYILANSTVLETLTVDPTEEIPEDSGVFKEMLTFQRASKYAAIVWVDPQGSATDAIV